MSVTERVMKLGSWNLKLKDPSLIDDVDYFDHVVIVGGDVHPDVLGDAAILSVARYSGIVRHKKLTDGKTLEIGGQGPEGWLGDEDRKGFVYETERAYSGDSFANVLTRSGSTPYGLLRDDAGAETAIHAGVVNSVAGTYTGTHLFQDQRSAIRYVCDVFDAEYRVNPDFTLDAGVESDLYQTTPSAVIARKTEGRDPNYEGVPLSKYAADVDAKDFTSRTILLAQGTGETLKTGAANVGSNPYLDPYGNPVVRVRMVNEAETSEDNANTRAQLHQNRFSTLRKGLTVSTREFDIEGSFNIGDTVYVWDFEEDQLVDTTNEIRFRGRILNPAAIRVLGATWPVTQGMSVFVRHGDGTYTDITESVDFETGDTQLEVGASPRSLTGDTQNQVVSGRVNVDPDGDDGTIPDVPTHANTPWGTSNYQDSEGRTRSQITVEWSTPLNTDASTITDGSHYTIRWRRQGQVDYQYSSVDWGTNLFLIQDLSPGVAYQISVQAVDIWGNASGYGTDETVIASADVTPPSTPAAPTVAGSPLYVQVSHDLGQASGGTFNLEADLDHLNVYIDTSSGFTPSAANLVGQIPATQAHLALGITVVGTFEVPDTTQRYVKVTAVDGAGNESAASGESTVTAQLIDTAHINDAAITTAKIDDLAVSNAKIANLAVDDAKVNDLSADKIDAGFLDAARIAAGSIKASKLAIGAGSDNLIHDPGFESGQLNTDTATRQDADPHTYTPAGGTWLSSTTAARSGGFGRYYRVNSQSSSAFIYFNGDESYNRSTDHLQKMAPATEGDQHSFSIYAHYRNVAPDAGINLRILYLDEDGNVLVFNNLDISSSLTTAYQKFTQEATAPAGTATVEFSVSINVQTSGATTEILFDDAYARRKAGSTVIEDGAVITDKIAAGAVIADRIASGAVTTDKLDAAAVTAAKIAAGTIEASNVKAKTLSADTFNLGVGADNLIHNPGFDDNDLETSPHDTEGSDGGGTWSYDSANARGGSGYALEYDVAGQTVNAFCYLNGGPGPYSRASEGLLKMPPASSGDRFLFTIFAKHNGTAPTAAVNIRLLSVDAGGTVHEFASKNLQPDLTSGYKRFTFFVDVHPNTIYVEPSINVADTQPSGCVLYFENATLRREIIPAGAISWFAVPSIQDIPDGWVLCDGSAISRTTHRTLFDTVGTLHGSGDGSTTFNIPDLLGRIMIGYSGGTSLVSGDTAGSWDHTHSGPSHQHGPGTLNTGGPSGVELMQADAVGEDVASSVHDHDVNTGLTAAAGTGATGSANPPVFAAVPAIKA